MDLRKEVLPETLEILAKNVKCIFVSAYDGESVLIWSKDKPLT